MHRNADVSRLPSGQLLAVQPVDVREFADWESLTAYVSSFAQRTKQLYIAHSVVDVNAHNEVLRSEPVEPKVPEHLAVFSQAFGCIHGSGHSQSPTSRAGNQYWNTRCPAQIDAHVTRTWSGGWCVVIADQFAFHNHSITTELVELYANARAMERTVESPAEATRQSLGAVETQQRQPPTTDDAVEIIDITNDEEMSDQSDKQPQNQEIPAQEQSDEDSINDVDAEDIDDDDGSDLDRCASNDEAVEAVKLDHRVRVRSMQHRSFKDWKELNDCLKAYSRSTHQRYFVRSACNVQSRNDRVKKNKSGNLENLVPTHFGFYQKQWECIHGNRSRTRHNLCCPATISAVVRRDKASGVWKVVITTQVALHSHHINKNIFRSYPTTNLPITDPALQTKIMELRFQGATYSEIMGYIHQHSNLEPSYNQVWTLIDKLKKSGWTRSRSSGSNETTSDSASGNIESEADEDDSGDLQCDKDIKETGNTQRSKLRSAGKANENPSLVRNSATPRKSRSSETSSMSFTSTSPATRAQGIEAKSEQKSSRSTTEIASSQSASALLVDIERLARAGANAQILELISSQNMKN